MTEPLIAKLDELIRAQREAGFGDRYLDAEGVAILLGYSYTYVRDRIVHKPDFPEPLRLDRDGHGRWLRSEVLNWARERTQRNRLGG